MVLSEIALLLAILAIGFLSAIPGALALRAQYRGGGVAFARELAECIEQREALQVEIQALRAEVARLRQRLQESEAELAALRRALSRMALRDEGVKAGSEHLDLLQQEREQLTRNIARLRLLIARQGEDVALLNELEQNERRLREVEAELDAARK